MAAIEPIHLYTTRLEEPAFRELCDAAFDYVISISPVATGYFQSHWEMEYDYPECYFTNETEYGEYLEDGWSQQAPSGMHGPVKDFVSSYV